MSHPAAAGTLLAMSGGKESLTALKLLENTPGLGLFFLQYDDPIWHHMARCQDRLQEDHPTLRVSFRRYKSIELINRYQSSDYFSLVIGQIVFNAMLYADRYRYLVIGNEYSANFGNAVYHGRAVNHQYDKGLAFARRVNAYIRQFVSRDFRYFSPFFGLYEYRIAQLFFADNRFLDIWTSCNNSNRAANFCCQCVKCAFTYVIALPWTTPKVLRRVFGRDLLDDLDLFRQLMDFDAAKPFDCVGGKEEVWLALHQARLQNKERNSPALRYFRTAILPGIEHRLPGIRKELEGEHTGLRYVPPEFRALLIRRLRSIGCRPTNATPPSGA